MGCAASTHDQPAQGGKDEHKYTTVDTQAQQQTTTTQPQAPEAQPTTPQQTQTTETQPQHAATAPAAHAEPAAHAPPAAEQAQGQSAGAPPAAHPAAAHASSSSSSSSAAVAHVTIVSGHAHPMLLFKARYAEGTIQYSCDLCGGDGEGASFSCEGCCVDAHPRCFKKAGGTAAVHSPDHPHQLTFFESRYDGTFGCNICGEQGEGEVWSCDACGFDAHEGCAMKGQKVGSPPGASVAVPPVPVAAAPVVVPAPGSAAIVTPPPAAHPQPQLPPPAVVSMISAHPHPLCVFKARYGELTFSCDMCAKSSVAGEPSCSCEACGWDAHVRCVKEAGGIVQVKSVDHDHVLSWFASRYQGSWSCDLCKKPGMGEAWSCDMCKWDACTACALKDQKVGQAPAAYLEAIEQEKQKQVQLKVQQQAQFAASLVASSSVVAAAPAPAVPGANISPTWPADNVAFPFPASPFAWAIGAEAVKLAPSTAKGADFSLYASHFPASFSADPAAFWSGFKRVVFFDLRLFHLWATGPLIDEAMNAVVWAAIFQTAARAAAGEGEAAWKDLAARGILCAPLEAIPTEGNSVFVTHRWSKAGGICSMSPSFFTAYTLFNCQIKGKAPCWVWLDLISVPQPVPTFSNPLGLTYSARESELRLLCNANYMSFVGLKFGAIALRCHFFLKHQPLVTIHENYKHPLTGEGGLNKYPRQRDYFKRWGMDEAFLQFDTAASAEKAGMTLLDQIKVYTTGTMMKWNALFYTDMSYVNRIWCIAEFAVRVSGRGQENFKDCVEFYARLWEQNAQDFKAHHDGPGVVRGLALREIKELKSDYVLHSLEGCRIELNAPSNILHAKLMSSMMSFEGLCCIVADAAATQVRDVPVVIATLYGDLCNRLFAGNKPEPPPIPPAMMAVLTWCIECGVGAPRMKVGDAGWPALQRSFYSLVDPASGIMKRYLEFTAAHMKQGANSLMLLERLLAILLINGKSLSYAASNDTVPAAAAAVKIATGGTPKGFEFAPTACWYLHDVLGLRVTDLFLDGDSGSNQPFLADFGPNLAATEDARFNPGTSSAWKAPKSMFPGYPKSEHLFSVENLLGGAGVVDPLCNFQSLTHDNVCPFRPVYAIAARQSDVGWTGRLGWFEKEHVYIQLTGSVRGVDLSQIRAWIKAMDDTTHPKAIRVFGSRTITATPKKILWNPNNDGKDKELH